MLNASSPTYPQTWVTTGSDASAAGGYEAKSENSTQASATIAPSRHTAA